jgi:hypothetical protein
MTAHDSVEIHTSVAADSRDLAALAAGDIQALILPQFASSETCTAVVSGFDRTHMGSYNPDQYMIPARRFGPTLNEYRAGHEISADYWEEAARVDLAHQQNEELRHLRQMCVDRITTISGRPCGSAATSAGRLFWGILREINEGTLIHWDDVLEEYPTGLLTTRITAQLAFNLFLVAPVSGGETRVWRKQPTAVDERYREKFGYRPEVVTGISSVLVEPEQGAAVLFNSRNYHRVHPCGPKGSRLTLSFFVGLTEQDHDLVLWS